MIGRALWRIIVVAFGFVVAAIIAAIVLVTLGLERATQVAQGKDVLGNSIEGVVDFLQASARLVSAMTLVPALALVVIGEVARIRSALYYVIGGGVALVAIPLFARFATAGGGPMPALMVWQIFATAGFAGGYVYWLVSGRRA
jgi:hypothetical protein